MQCQSGCGEDLKLKPKICVSNNYDLIRSSIKEFMIRNALKMKFRLSSIFPKSTDRPANNCIHLSRAELSQAKLRRQIFLSALRLEEQ